MGSTVAWLDYDEEQQRRTQMMLDALSERTAVDELGLGILRDLIAGTLHPGMTVLLTRARYLLFVPWVYRGLANTSTDANVQAGRLAEIGIAKALISHYRHHGMGADETGIIGRRALDDTKRLASGGYWPLLRRLGILTTNQSIAEYCRDRAALLADYAKRQPFHVDDELAITGTHGWVELPVTPNGWPKVSEMSFTLTSEEAEFLRGAFLAADPHLPDNEDASSLVSWLLGEERSEWVTGVRWVWEHPFVADFPSTTARVMRMGEGLDRLMHGARIVYNARCAQGAHRDDLVEKYRDQMALWSEEIKSHDVLGSFSLESLWQWTESTLLANAASPRAMIRWRATKAFVTRWRELVGSADDLLSSEAAARLVRDREASLKPGRARLSDLALLSNWQGDSGIGRFDYGWLVASRILTDVHDGLRTTALDVAEVDA